MTTPTRIAPGQLWLTKPKQDLTHALGFVFTDYECPKLIIDRFRGDLWWMSEAMTFAMDGDVSLDVVGGYVAPGVTSFSPGMLLVRGRDILKHWHYSGECDWFLAELRKEGALR